MGPKDIVVGEGGLGYVFKILIMVIIYGFIIGAVGWDSQLNENARK